MTYPPEKAHPASSVHLPGLVASNSPVRMLNRAQLQRKHDMSAQDVPGTAGPRCAVPRLLQ
jgi:hypothetical protein